MLKHVLKIDSQKAIFIAFILFFSYKSWYAMLRVGKFQFTKLASILLIYAFVFLGAYLSKKVRSKLIIFAGVFVLCAGAFLLPIYCIPIMVRGFFIMQIMAFLIVCFTLQPESMHFCLY